MMTDKNILIITCLHKRLALADKVIRNWKHVCEKHLIRPHFIAGVSSEEEVAFCLAHRIHYALCENNPVGRKWNFVLRCANIIRVDYSHVLFMDSDDFMRDDFFYHYNSTKYHQGLNCIYVSDGEITHIVKLNNGISGAGRMLTRTAFEGLLSKYPENVFPDKDRGLDPFIHNKLIDCGFFPVKINTPVLMDYKTDVNIWPISIFSKFPKLKNTEEVLNRFIYASEE
jgi:hypothetical protein